MPGQRTYGAAHKRLRAQLASLVARGGVKCWRCVEAKAPNPFIRPGQAWDLGHDDHDRRVYRGPEHRKCNRGTRSRREGAREIVRRVSREW